MRDHYREMYLLRSRLPRFRRRVQDSTQVLEEFLSRCERPFVSWSGGKDSLAVLILLAQMGRTDVPVFTQADDMGWPDKQAFCKETTRRLGFADHTYEWSDKSGVAQLAEGRERVRGTFSHVFERYAHARRRTGTIMGLRSEESNGRGWLRRTRGRIYTVGDEVRAIPIADWSGEDVFALILSTGTPYMHVYDKDDEKAPHEIRFSWMFHPRFRNSGGSEFVKRHYPDLFNRFAARYPEARRYL